MHQGGNLKGNKGKYTGLIENENTPYQNVCSGA